MIYAIVFIFCLFHVIQAAPPLRAAPSRRRCAGPSPGGLWPWAPGTILLQIHFILTWSWSWSPIKYRLKYVKIMLVFFCWNLRHLNLRNDFPTWFDQNLGKPWRYSTNFEPSNPRIAAYYYVINLCLMLWYPPNFCFACYRTTLGGRMLQHLHSPWTANLQLHCFQALCFHHLPQDRFSTGTAVANVHLGLMQLDAAYKQQIGRTCTVLQQQWRLRNYTNKRIQYEEHRYSWLGHF